MRYTCEIRSAQQILGRKPEYRDMCERQAVDG